jgi:uncharacterized protein YtpQ (UPF0354 family)
MGRKEGQSMKMTVQKMRKLLEERLQDPTRKFIFDRDKSDLRIENIQNKKGVNISIPTVISKWNEKKEAAIDEIVFFVNEGLKAMNTEVALSGNEKNIYPVMRSTSHKTVKKDGVKLIYDDHTAETRIFYAIDLGKTYRIIDEEMLEKEGWDANRIREVAKFNLRSLPTPLKKDTVAENDFYFLNTNDGYDASRILNDALLKEMEDKVEGKLVISIPHQDVLIFADIKNDTGYDVLAQMTMSFYTNGRIPITSLSFDYEDGKLMPIFIMANNRPKRKD